jgi:hypothetical protein
MNSHKTLLISALLISTSTAAPQMSGTDANEQARAAETAVRALRTQALNQMRQIAATGRYQLMGMKTSTEADRAVAGDPIAVFWLDIKGIPKAIADPTHPSLLAGVGRVMVPILVDGTLRSGIIFERNGESWKPLIFGEKALSPVIHQAASVTKSKAPPESGTAHVVVSIPTLGVVATATLAGKSFGISSWNKTTDNQQAFSAMKREDFLGLSKELKVRGQTPTSVQILRDIKALADRREEFK